jgi:hypothetical protein
MQMTMHKNKILSVTLLLLEHCSVYKIIDTKPHE